MSRKALLSVYVSCVLLLTAHGLAAQVARQGNDLLSSLAFADPLLRPAPAVATLEAAQSALAAEVGGGWASFQAGSPMRWQAYVDRRTGRIDSAVGGGIRWTAGSADLASLEATARAFLPSVAPLLGADPGSLVLDHGRSGLHDGQLWYVDFNVERAGMTVEGARVVFRVSHGNLIEIGAENLPAPDAEVPTAQISREQALAALSSYVRGFDAGDFFLDGGSLHLLPADVADPSFSEGFQPGDGRGLALVWQLSFHRRGVTGNWRARVDAVTGEVREFLDTNRYDGRVTGGAFAQSPTVSPEAVLPMPFADVSGAGFTDSTGAYTSGGPVTSILNGQYAKIVDLCGAISKTSDWKGDVEFGTSTGTDCVTPGTGGAGNTHSARTQFYNVNRIKEVGRAWLPANTWLPAQLTVNVNLNDTCNAYWDDVAGNINFFKSGGGCANTGEIAGVSLHEYGHGLDQNDGNDSSADLGTGETYGDFTAALMTHNSCIGPGFRASNCSGYGDACTSCTGVRDIDYAKHGANTPATVEVFTRARCPTSGIGYIGPCGREAHCESYVSSEGLWDFANRDLPNPGTAAAWTIEERLWYLSRPTATKGLVCSTGSIPWTSNGCATGTYWRTMRAADDDDGNLTNGTPHSCQLFAAFNRHGLACATDPGANVCFSACTPPAVPSLTLTPGPGQVLVSWTNSGAGIVYDVYRSELGCGSGFIRVAENVASLSYNDTAVAGGLTYSYQVVAHPTGGTACAAAPSSCQTSTPTVPPCTPPGVPTGLTATGISISRIDLSWTPVGGATGYNVYRASSAGGPYTLRATVTSPAFSDTGLSGGTPSFYKVRSFATRCESADSAVSSASTVPCVTVPLYQSDFETGSGLAGWTNSVLSGGSATNDWRGIQTCSPAHSGTKIFRFGGATCTAAYGNDEISLSAPPAVTIPAAGAGNTRLSFWHRRDFEAGFDGGLVAAKVDAGSFVFGPATALSGETYDGTVAGPGAGTCPPGATGGTPIFGGTKGTMVNTVVDLDAFCDQATAGTGGCAGHTVQPGFVSISDCSVTLAGWFLDDVQVSTCVASAGQVDYYTLTPCRVIDTRLPPGPQGGPALGAGAERSVTVAGTCGVPASAKALAYNVTVVQTTGPGYLQVLPGGAGSSLTAAVTFATATTLANNGVLPLAFDGSGTILVRSGAGTPVNFVIDVTGYFQ